MFLKKKKKIMNLPQYSTGKSRLPEKLIPLKNFVKAYKISFYTEMHSNQNRFTLELLNYHHMLKVTFPHTNP